MKTGDIFPAQFTDKGPDLDIRMARTLTGGDNVGVIVVISIQKSIFYQHLNMYQ